MIKQPSCVYYTYHLVLEQWFLCINEHRLYGCNKFTWGKTRSSAESAAADAMLIASSPNVVK